MVTKNMKGFEKTSYISLVLFLTGVSLTTQAIDDTRENHSNKNGKSVTDLRLAVERDRKQDDIIIEELIEEFKETGKKLIRESGEKLNNTIEIIISCAQNARNIVHSNTSDKPSRSCFLDNFYFRNSRQ